MRRRRGPVGLPAAALEEIRERMAATPDVPEEIRLGREMEEG